MPHAYCLQDWILVRGGAGTIIVQEAADWFDFGAFQGVTPLIGATSNVVGSPVLTIETAPTQEQSLFQVLKHATSSASYTVTAGLTSGPTFSWTTAQSGDVPPARWLRWSITSSSAWMATIRIWLNVIQGRGGAASDVASEQDPPFFPRRQILARPMSYRSGCASSSARPPDLASGLAAGAQNVPAAIRLATPWKRSP
jgi:hypothetical protein